MLGSVFVLLDGGADSVVQVCANWGSIIGALAVLFGTVRWIWKRVKDASDEADREFDKEVEDLQSRGGKLGGRTDLGFFVNLEVGVRTNAIGQYRMFAIIFAIATAVMFDLLMWSCIAGEAGKPLHLMIKVGGLVGAGATLSALIGACRARALLTHYVGRVQRIWRTPVDKRSPK